MLGCSKVNVWADGQVGPTQRPGQPAWIPGNIPVFLMHNSENFRYQKFPINNHLLFIIKIINSRVFEMWAGILGHHLLDKWFCTPCLGLTPIPSSLICERTALTWELVRNKIRMPDSSSTFVAGKPGWKTSYTAH